jgi:dephospho-CoA kinase
MDRLKMLVIALTGGIGSGKSTVTKLFSAHSVPIIDADAIAKSLTLPDQPAYFTIVTRYGNNILHKDGRINRAKLRHLIFNDPNERTWLEDLLHPLIRNEIIRQIEATTAPYCIIEIPLLLESDYSYPFINRILVVDTPEHLQIKRTTARDNIHPEHVESIISAQISREERLKCAHDVLVNDGKIEDLAPQVEKMHTFYLSLANK